MLLLRRWSGATLTSKLHATDDPTFPVSDPFLGSLPHMLNRLVVDDDCSPEQVRSCINFITANKLFSERFGTPQVRLGIQSSGSDRVNAIESALNSGKAVDWNTEPPGVLKRTRIQYMSQKTAQSSLPTIRQARLQAFSFEACVQCQSRRESSAMTAHFVTCGRQCTQTNLPPAFILSFATCRQRGVSCCRCDVQLKHKQAWSIDAAPLAGCMWDVRCDSCTLSRRG